MEAAQALSGGPSLSSITSCIDASALSHLGRKVLHAEESLSGHVSWVVTDVVGSLGIVIGASWFKMLQCSDDACTDASSSLFCEQDVSAPEAPPATPSHPATKQGSKTGKAKAKAQPVGEPAAKKGKQDLDNAL